MADEAYYALFKKDREEPEKAEVVIPLPEDRATMQKVYWGWFVVIGTSWFGLIMMATLAMSVPVFGILCALPYAFLIWANFKYVAGDATLQRKIISILKGE